MSTTPKKPHTHSAAEGVHLGNGSTEGEYHGGAHSLAGGTHFHRFGLPISHSVDAQALEKAYEEQCFATHPDLLHGASEKEQAQALEQSASINRAYQVLLHENSRSAYLLTLLAHGQNLKALPPGFLEEMLLLQEEVEEAAGNPKASVALKQQVQQQHQRCVEERVQLFSAISPLQPNVPMFGATLQKISENLNVERYLQRILEMLA